MVDISRACGSDTTAISIKRALDRHIKPHIKRINDALEKGEDPKGLNIGVDNPATNGQSLTSRYLLPFHDLVAAMQTIHLLMFFAEIQAYFGSDSTAVGIRFQYYSRIKPDVDLLLQARRNGIDCKEVKLRGDAKGQTSCFYFCIALVRSRFALISNLNPY